MRPPWWEERLVDQLLRSPSFHRAVQRIHRTINGGQGARPAESTGGTKIEDPNANHKGIKHFFELFWEELKTGHRPEPKNRK